MHSRERASSYRVRYQSPDGSMATIDDVLVSDYAVPGLRNATSYTFSVAAVGANGVTSFSNELTATPTTEMSWDALAEAFAGPNPTRSSCPFWMVHGRETDEELRKLMEVVYRFGFEGVTLHPYDFQGFLEEGMWRRWRGFFRITRLGFDLPTANLKAAVRPAFFHVRRSPTRSRSRV